MVATFVGLLFGRLLDGLFKTSPYLTIIFLLLGIVSGFIDLYRTAKKHFGDDDDDDDGKQLETKNGN